MNYAAIEELTGSKTAREIIEDPLDQINTIRPSEIDKLGDQIRGLQIIAIDPIRRGLEEEADIAGLIFYLKGSGRVTKVEIETHSDIETVDIRAGELRPLLNE